MIVKPSNISALATRRRRAVSGAPISWPAWRRPPYHSKIGQPAKLLVRVCCRFGQDCHVIRNPILAGVRPEQIVLVPAYAGNPRRALLESYRKPRTVDRHGRPSFLITERADRHIRQLWRSAKRNLENEIDLNE